MSIKEANKQVQLVSVVPKGGWLQQEHPVSEAVEHFALGEEELCLGQWPCLALDSLLLPCPTFYHCCCSLFPNKRKENPFQSRERKLSIQSVLASYSLAPHRLDPHRSDHAPSTTPQFPTPDSYDITLLNDQCQWSLFIPCCISGSSAPLLPRDPLSFGVN